MLADAQGQPVQVGLGPGQQHDCTRAVELLGTVPRTRKVLADKAYDANRVSAAVAAPDAERRPYFPVSPVAEHLELLTA